MKNNVSKNIYLDVCALCRPFDDQNYLRIKMETVAVDLILSKVKSSFYALNYSPVHESEIKSIEDEFERQELFATLNFLGKPIDLGIRKSEVKKRTKELIDLKFGIADAAHLAFAEASNSFFISCDDKLISRCKRHDINVWYGSPIEFCEKEDIK